MEDVVFVPLKKGDIIPVVKYRFDREYDLTSKLPKMREHRRLSVFHHKGTACANINCHRVGTRIIAGTDRGGNFHIDVYTNDLVLMTVDHVMPRSKGGSESLDNKVPLCQVCNSWKGDKFDGLEGFIDPAVHRRVKKCPTSIQSKKATVYGRKWRKAVRKSVFAFHGKGDPLVTWKPIPQNKLHVIQHRKKIRDQ